MLQRKTATHEPAEYRCMASGTPLHDDSHTELERCMVFPGFAAQEADRPSLSNDYTLAVRHCTWEADRLSLHRLSACDSTLHRKQTASLLNDYRLVLRHCTSEAERLSLQRLSNCDSALHIGSRTPLSRTAIELRLGTAQWKQNASLSSTAIEL